MAKNEALAIIEGTVPAPVGSCIDAKRDYGANKETRDHKRGWAKCPVRIFIGSYPFERGKKKPSFKKVSGEELSDSAKDLLQALLRPEGSQRLTLERCKETPQQ